MNQDVVRDILEKRRYFERVDSIHEHITKYIGQVSDTLFEEIDGVFITYFIVSPNSEHPYYTIVTCSTSITDVTNDNDLEFCLSVPMEWSFLDNPAALIQSKDPQKLFVVRLLREVIKFNLNIKPLGVGHTITGSQDSPFPEFVSVMVHLPELFNEEFCFTESNTPSLILGIYPLFEEEYQFKIKNGSDELMDLLYNGAMVFDPRRKNVCI